MPFKAGSSRFLYVSICLIVYSSITSLIDFKNWPLYTHSSEPLSAIVHSNFGSCSIPSIEVLCCTFFGFFCLLAGLMLTFFFGDAEEFIEILFVYLERRINIYQILLGLSVFKFQVDQSTKLSFIDAFESIHTSYTLDNWIIAPGNHLRTVHELYTSI